MMSLQERVKELRKQHSWSQGELAERVGADPAQISRYENGRITPSADVIVKLAETFDVSTDYLLIEHSPRRAFRPPENALGDHLATIDELSAEDLASLLNVLDGLVMRSRLKALTADRG